MRITLAYLLFLTASIFRAQAGMQSDTIKIGEIVVSESAVGNVLSGFQNIKIDSSAIKEFSLESLGEILTQNSSLFIKSYGPGSSSTLSFRGTGASHTQLLWNELSLNSSMLGQADLSMIPAGFLDDIRIYQGGASMIVGNGGLGGIINVETKPDWNSGTSLLLNAGTGSFGTYSALVKARAGTEKFQSVTRAYMNSSDNNYSYINDISYPEPVYEERLNAGVNQKSFMQELHFRSARSVTSASLWYNNSDRNIPSNMLMPQTEGSENQKDESLRMVLSHNLFNYKTTWEGVIAWFSDKLNYVNIPASVDSKNNMNYLFLKASAERSLGRNTWLKINLNSESDFVSSNNYEDDAGRNLTNFTTSIRRLEGNRFGWVVLVRETFDDFKPLVPDFSAGTDFKLFSDRAGAVRINLARNSKVPTLNDRYWNPGGNPDLKNEYSYTGEISFEYNGNLSDRISCSTMATGYMGRIYNLIQWVPSSYGYWSPQNVSESGTHGFESILSLNYSNNKTHLRLKGLYSHTRAYYISPNEQFSHNQIIYVPENQFNIGLKAGYGNFYSGINSIYTGRRYTSVDNEKSLPPYTLTGLTAGFKINTGPSYFDISVKADNIFNVDYEIIAYYPMPGRSFMFSLTYQFLK
jgi:iron complex outermembrane receptor protein